MTTTPNAAGAPQAGVSIRPKQSPVNRSGAHWVNRFPGSTETRALNMPFRGRAEAFISALRAAGAIVTISATLRDPRRAYLMHWAWRIVKTNVDPASVPAMDGVDILWAHEGADGKVSRAASLAAAQTMVIAFGMQHLGVAPALNSRHTLGCATDMNIRWNGTLSIADARGNTVEIKTTPRSGMNWQLRQVGESYGVIKYKHAGRDDPHWSDNGA